MPLSIYFKNLVKWWLSGLILALPVSLRHRLFDSPNRLFITLDGDTLELTLCKGSTGDVISRFSSSGGDRDRADINYWLDSNSTGYMETTLLLDGNQVLVKRLILPEESEHDLREILGFDMDRQTPFSREQVYYDYQVLSGQAPPSSISVDLFVAMREYVEPLINRVGSLSIPLTGISCSKNGNRVPINLLPAPDRVWPDHRLKPGTRIAIISALVSFLALLYVPLIQNHYELAQMRARLDLVRTQAQTLRPLIAEKQMLSQRLFFLSERRRDAPPVISLLTELTNLLPDDTYLERVVLHDREIQLQGEAGNATQVIKVLEDSAWFTDAQPRSPITKNNVTDKERFQISARVLPEHGI